MIAVVALAASPTPAEGAPARRLRFESHGPWGGSVWALAIDPKDRSTIYAGMDGNGIFKTTTAGRSWRRASTGLPANVTVYDISIARSRPSVILAASMKHGLFRTTNGGRSWKRVGKGLNLEMLDVEIDPRRSNVVFASDSENIFRSSNSGSSWRLIRDHEDQVIQEGVVGVAPSNSRIVYAFSQDGFFRSTNGGRRWTLMNQHTLGTPHGVLVHSRKPSIVYAFDGGSLMRSRDSGRSWALVSELKALSAYEVAIDTVDPRRIAVIGEAGLLITTSAGRSWRRIDIEGASSRSVAMTPRAGKLYVGHFHRGVSVSPNLGRSWRTRNRGLGGAGVSSIVATTRNVVYATVPYVGVAKSRNGGRSWRYVGLHRRPVSTLAATSGGRTVYASITTGARSSLFKSTNGGKTWKVLRRFKRHWSIRGLVIAPSRQRLVYLALSDRVGEKSYLFRSPNGGRTWRRTGTPAGNIYSLAVHPSRPNLVYAGLGGVARSRDGGRTWKVEDDTDSYYSINSLALDPPRTVYASVDEFDIFKSTDWGANFHRAERGLWKGRLGAIAIDPRHPRTLYAVATRESYRRGAVFRTTNGGRRWREISSSLRPSLLGTIAVNPSGTRVYVAGGGVQVARARR